MRREDGLTRHEVEYKTRRFVNDYLEPPKVTAKMEIGQRRFAEIREDMSLFSEAGGTEMPDRIA